MQTNSVKIKVFIIMAIIIIAQMTIIYFICEKEPPGIEPPLPVAVALNHYEANLSRVLFENDSLISVIDSLSYIINTVNIEKNEYKKSYLETIAIIRGYSAPVQLELFTEYADNFRRVGHYGVGSDSIH